MSIKQKEDLVKISHYLGDNLEYAQGGGGNTSVKLDGNLMLIKASGYKLSQVSTENGFVSINYPMYRQKLSEKIDSLTEDGYSELGTKCLSEPTQLKPSIETCFHSSLDALQIMHSHSIFCNILCCSVEGRKLIESLFPESYFVEYAPPGKNLAFRVLQAISGKETYQTIIFLQNHGVIIGARSSDECIDLHEHVNHKIKERFSLIKGLDKNAKAVRSDQILFPDQAVYSVGTLETEAARDTVLAANYIESKIFECGLTPNYLEKKEAEFLLNMESEKYRQKMAFNEK
jgi:rhamnose utilization protein RhaD (predicted bifunctional aldolase and dehydrogenase)